MAFTNFAFVVENKGFDSLVRLCVSISMNINFLSLQGLDVGAKSNEDFQKVIASAKTIVWNG